MKQIINGRKYDTETAELIASDGHGYASDFEHWREALYRKRTGEFFLAGEGGALSHYSVSLGNNGRGGGSAIRPLSDAQARAWMEQHAGPDDYERVFGDAPE